MIHSNTAAEVQLPDASAAEVQLPDATAAEVQLPDATAAELQVPDTLEPMDCTESGVAESNSPVECKRKTS